MSKDKVGDVTPFLGVAIQASTTVMSELAIHGVGKFVAMFCFITSNVLAAE